MRNFLVFVAALLAMFFVVSCDSSSGGDDGECETSADCEDGYECSADKECVFIQVTPDPDVVETPDPDIPTSYCGDATVDEGEECDLGAEANIGSYGGCNADCTKAPHCGDAIINGQELCDDGEENGTYDKCASDCSGVGETCGDGILNGEEACDDGELNGTYGKCLVDCSALGQRCGDAVLQKEVCPEPEVADEDVVMTDEENIVPDTDVVTLYTGETDEDVVMTDTEVADEDVVVTDEEPVTDTEVTDEDVVETEAPVCEVVAGVDENCDEGELNGTYGHCDATCSGFYGCGDAVINGEEGVEDCDNGLFNGTSTCVYGDTTEDCVACGSDCKDNGMGLQVYCGDGVVQNEDCSAFAEGECEVIATAAETCDNAENNSDDVYGACHMDCSGTVRCGDDITNGTETCDGNTKACNEFQGVFSADSFATCNEDCGGWDQSPCTCATHYSGSNCLTCDGSYFCNGHGTCSATTDGSATCACTDHFTGAKCNECESGYVLYDDRCVKDCASSCGQTIMPGITTTSHGHCDYSGAEGVCACDDGWATTGVALVKPTIVTPECAEYMGG